MQSYNEAMKSLREQYANQPQEYARQALSNMQGMIADTGKMFEAFYKQASLLQKKNALQEEQARRESLRQQLQSLYEYADENSQVRANIASAMQQLQQEEVTLNQRALKMEQARNSERYKQLGPIQRMNFLLEQQEKYNKRLKQIEEDRAAALADAADETERAAINAEADIQISNLNATQVTGGKGSNALTKAASLDKAMPPWVTAILDGLTALGNSIQKAAQKSVDEALSVYTKYMGSIDARLQGTNTNFAGMMSTIQQRVGVSAFVNQKQLVEAISKLSSEGIAYNLEQRAYLQTLSDRMVTTFNVLDASLTRLIRLQQSDVTAVALGSEATLTQFLNSVFQDTSYLNSLYDSVYGAIIDASSQFNTEDQTRYAYNVQKWLGSLYSTGLSESAVGMIAQGLNALTTGNVSALNSNSSLQTLFGLAAQRSGMSYSSILTQGLNAEGVNNLMKSVVELLQDIAKNTSNQVTKSAWSEILNMTLSDFRAVSNLTSTDISSIYGSNVTYQSALNETSNQLNSVVARTHMQTRIDNTIDNLLLNWANDLVADQEGYKKWKLTHVASDLIADLTESIPLVGKVVRWITGIGGGIFDLINLGLPDFSNLDLTNATALGLGTFDFQQYTSRGSVANTIAGYGGGPASLSGLSYSATTNQNSADRQLVTLAQNAQSTTLTSVTSDKNATIIRTASDLYSKIFEERVPIRVQVASLETSAQSDFAEAMDTQRFHADNHAILEAIENQSQPGFIQSATSAALSFIRGNF